MSWKPIESAPKDGTELLLFVPNDEPQVVVGRWEQNEFDEYWQYSEQLVAEVVGMIESPTHWMPLPTVPAA